MGLISDGETWMFETYFFGWFDVVGVMAGFFNTFMIEGSILRPRPLCAFKRWLWACWILTEDMGRMTIFLIGVSLYSAGLLKTDTISNMIWNKNNETNWNEEIKPMKKIKK